MKDAAQRAGFEPARRTKGVVVIGVVKYLRVWSRRAPDHGLSLSGGARRLLEATAIVPSSWYDYEAYLELLRAIHEQAFRVRDDALVGS